MRNVLSILLFASALVAACRRDAPRADPQLGAPTAVQTPASPSTSPSPPSSVPRFRPGQGIGPVDLGMTLAALDALGLSPKQTSWSSAVYEAGPYRVVFRDGVVDSVEVELAALPGGIVVGGVLVPPSERSIETIASNLEGCGPLEVRIGGNVIRCDGGASYVKAGGPPGIVALQVVARPEGQS